MKENIINNLAVPIIVTVIGGFIVLWLWRINTKKIEKRKLYLPLLNEFAYSLSSLLSLIDRDYPRVLLEDTSTNIHNQFRFTAEFLNLPENLKTTLEEVQKIKSKHIASLNALIKKVTPLEEKLEHKQYQKRPIDYYVIDFIINGPHLNCDVLLNFPTNSGGFHSLYCDKSIAHEILTTVTEYQELSEYKEIKNAFILAINSALKQISYEQSV